MGKIKVATLGSDQEEALKEKQKVKREEKKKRESAGKRSEKVHIPGMKGGKRIKSGSEMSEEELDRMARLTEEVEKDEKEGIKPAVAEKKARKKPARVRGAKYKQALMKVDHNKVYPIAEAIPLLRDVSFAKFDPTIELHINTIEKGLRGTVKLPHGTGREIRVAVADESTIDRIVSSVEEGRIEFDMLVAHPAVMGKLAKVARFLGPKGLMPNPKAGTISPTPEKVAGKFKGGEINWKTEAEFPLIHQRIGKLSFKDKEIEENFLAFVKSVRPEKIRNVTVKSTMSPGVKVKYQ